MKITFLGTAGSIMTENKSFPSILINNDLLLDCGEGCTQKLLQLKSIDTINTICISHLHGDHFSGLFSLLWYYWLSNRTADLTIIGPPQTKMTTEKIFTLMNAPGGFEALNFKIHFKELANTNEIQEIKVEFKIKSAKMDHAIVSFAYRLEKNDKSICYSGDTKPTQLLVKLADKCDILICESTFPDKYIKFADEYGHTTPSDAAKMAREANCQKLVLVHLYPLFAKKVIKSKSNLKDKFDKEIIIAEDLLTLEI
ncbi:MAG: MBL fold metallo-hydrolase [Promethearchaeota archaeon]